MDALAVIAVAILERFPARFRAWLERLPNRDPSQLSTLGRAGRLLLAIVISLAFASPFVWLVTKL